MLLDKNISKIKLNSDEWHQERIGRFTSSENHLLMGVNKITDGGISYIYRKVGEVTAGMPSKDDVTTAATAHGNTYEIEGLQRYRDSIGVDFIAMRVFVKDGERFGSTPDAIQWLGDTQDENGEKAFNVKTIEVKCPYSFNAYIALWKCKTPADVKKEEKAYYYQVLDQMIVCGALRGVLVIYQPFFKDGGLRVIEFVLTDKESGVLEDYNLLKQRRKLAEKMFDELRAELVNS